MNNFENITMDTRTLADFIYRTIETCANDEIGCEGCPLEYVPCYSTSYIEKWLRKKVNENE